MYNEIRWEECALGKKLYTKENISKAETEWLGIPELVVLKTNRDDVGLEVVHRRYFEDEKLLCPACRSSRTRCSKIVDRKLKDLLWLDEDHKTFQIISLLFHQRYMRCDNCGQSVFPEPTEFGEKGCKFTNRLSDALADGTFQFSYKKVCQHYGVPASTASVGEVMRRRIQYRESLLPPVRTPHIISIVEVVFFGEFYPAVLGIWDGEVYCLDILRDSSEETCGAFLKTLDAKQVEIIYVDPVDSLFNAVNQYFPMASIVVTDEAVQRYARNAMLDIIHSDGKRFPVVHKDRRLTVLHKDLDDRTVVPRIKEGMKSRPRLQQAYNHHQKLLELMETKWSMEDLRTWADQIPAEVDEFLAVGDIIDIFGEQLSGFLTLGEKPPNNYQFAVQGICDAIKDKPADRFDDPFFAEKLIAEKEGIFLWMLEGLRRLIANHYHFTISQRAKDNITSAVRDANNILDFLDSEGYVAFKADYEASTKNLYAAYKRWCEDNAENPLSPKSFANQLSQNAERYHLEPVSNLHIGGGKRCRGYMGIYVLLSPMEL